MTIGPYENSPTPDQAEMVGYHQPSRVGYERSNPNVRGVFWFCVWFVIVAAVIQVLIWFIYRGMVGSRERADVQQSALAGQRPGPPEPRLQPTVDRPGQPQSGHANLPYEDMQDMVKRENQEFARRGWEVDDRNNAKPPQSIVDEITRISAPGAVQPNVAPAIPAAPNIAPARAPEK